ESPAPSACGPTDAGESPDRPSQSHEHVAPVRRRQQTGHEITDFTAQGTELRRGRWVVPQEAHRRPEGAERKADGLERLTGPDPCDLQTSAAEIEHDTRGHRHAREHGASAQTCFFLPAEYAQVEPVPAPE